MSFLLQASLLPHSPNSQIGQVLTKSGLDRFVYVKTSLLDLHLKMGCVTTARVLFDEMPERDTVALISRNGYECDAWKLCIVMLQQGFSTDEVKWGTYAGCYYNSKFACLHLGKKLHGYTLRNNFENEKFVCTALIDMYAKCGNVLLAEHKNSVHSNMELNDIRIQLIRVTKASSFLLHGNARAGIETGQDHLFGSNVCMYSWRQNIYFRAMIKEFGVSPNLQHYALMVGLLGRACLFTEALSLIWKMDIKPDSTVWGALLSACIVHREVELGEYVAKKMFMLDHRNGGLYSLRS